MKKVYCPFLMFSVLLLNGCSIQDHTAVPEEKAKTEVSAATESEEEQDETKSETYLELISFENHSPYYTCHFQKIDGKTGQVSVFEYRPDTEDSTVVTAPEHVEVFPSEVLGLLTSSFSGEENPEDTISLSFWNRGDQKTFQIIIDDLEYELSLPEEETEETELNQKLEHEGAQAMLDKAVVYPHAMLLELSGIDSTHWNCDYGLVNPETQEIIKPLIFYEEDLEKLSLLFISDNEISEDGLTLRISAESMGSETGEVYHDYDVNFSRKENTTE